MKLLVIFLCLLFVSEEEIPFKAKEEFDLKLEFQFKPRPTESATYRVGYERLTQSSGPLPYLIIHMMVLKQQDDEYKLKVVNSAGKVVVLRKVETEKKVTIDLGFTDDLKDHVMPYEYTFFFISNDKVSKRKVVIHFDSDGTYTVNNEKRGKI